MGDKFSTREGRKKLITKENDGEGMKEGKRGEGERECLRTYSWTRRELMGQVA